MWISYERRNMGGVCCCKKFIRFWRKTIQFAVCRTHTSLGTWALAGVSSSTQGFWEGYGLYSPGTVRRSPIELRIELRGLCGQYSKREGGGCRYLKFWCLILGFSSMRPVSHRKYQVKLIGNPIQSQTVLSRFSDENSLENKKCFQNVKVETTSFSLVPVRAPNSQ